MAITQQGRFTSTGITETLSLPAGVDWMRVINVTQAAATTGDCGIEFLWQRGFADNVSYMYYKDGATDFVKGVMSTGFTYVDSTTNPVGALDATVTAVSTDDPPRVTVTSTTGLSDYDIVRMVDVAGAQQICGIDFSITIRDGTTFDLEYCPQIVAGTTGGFRLIKYPPLYYPPLYYISSITKAAQAVVKLTVFHHLTVGQQVRFSVGVGNGMTEINDLVGQIVSVNSTLNTITVNIDTTTFTTFAWPLTAYGSYTPAAVIPIGEGNVASLDDATTNVGYFGMILGAGTQAPAGSASDVIYWQAGTSDYILNT